MKKLVTTSTAARNEGVSTQTIRRWIKEGIINAIKDKTGRYRIDQDELNKRLNL